MAARVWPQLLLHRMRTGEAMLFTCLGRPLAWFCLSTVYAGVVWLLFVYDMRLIRARLTESHSAAERGFYTQARSDQLLNISALVPLLFFFNLASTIAIYRVPDFFINGGGHVWLISAQLISFIVYLVYVTRFFARIAPLVLQSKEAG